MLSVIPWVAAHDGGVSIDELCRRFDIDRDRLIADLETVSMVGTAPFTPDVLIEVILDDDHVSISLPQAFRRPLRISPEQGLALLARTQGLLAVPGADPEGPLATGLAKLAHAIGVELDTTLGIELGQAEPIVFELLENSLKRGKQVSFDYYSHGRDRHTHRTVDPLGLSCHRGQWYLTAFCHMSNDARTFRLDRISKPHMLEDAVDPKNSENPGVGYQPADDDPVIELLLAPTARWVIERYPYQSVVKLDDSRLLVRMAISSQAWLERLMLRLGQEGQVQEGPEALRCAGASAARRVLSRYRVD